MKKSKKTVFVSHPISGDMEKNIKKVLDICRKIHSKNIIPVAPYLVSLQYLDEEITENRELGIEANLECFERGYIDELWLFGDFISKGMRQEIKVARKFNIPVVAKSGKLKIYLTTLLLP